MKQTLLREQFPKVITYEHFSLQLYPREYEMQMTMQMSTSLVRTYDLPQTFPILQKLLPSIFTSKCFNDNKYPFIEEVRNTEMGHLFEHILLEYLCIEQVRHGDKDAIFSGVTKWNWTKDPRGTFHIRIDTGWDKSDMLFVALERSIQLLNTILDTKKRASVISN